MSTYETNIPGASGYAGAAALAKRAYDNAMLRFQNQRSQTLLKYGYTKGANGSYGVDPNNEYGQYQQMLRGEDKQVEGLQRAQAGSGWGGDSGYLGKQRDDLSLAQGGEQAALGADLTGQLSDIAQGEQGASYDQDAALYQAQQAAAEKAIQDQAFDPGDYSGLNAPPAAAAAPAKGKKAQPATHTAGRTQLLKAAAKKRAAAKTKGRRR